MWKITHSDVTFDVLLKLEIAEVTNIVTQQKGLVRSMHVKVLWARKPIQILSLNDSSFVSSLLCVTRR